MLKLFDILPEKFSRFLKTLGLVDPARIKASAFDQLQNKLFRLSGVQVVHVKGLAKFIHADSSDSPFDVLVVTSVSTSSELEHDVDAVFSVINRHYGTTFRVAIERRTHTHSSPQSQLFKSPASPVRTS